MTTLNIKKYMAHAGLSLGMMILSVLVAVLSSCSSADGVDIPADTSQGVATLKLNVGVNVPSGSATRSARTDFESAATAGEMMSSLRVIIARPDGTVEHNAYFSFPGGESSVGPLEFKVIDNERKSVYLFANHTDLTHDFSTYAVGTNLHDSYPLSELRLRRDLLDQPLFVEGQLVPMSESFEVFVSGGESDGTQIENLFVSRAAVKFSFGITRASGFSGAGRAVRSIEVTGIADTQYLLPRDTEYQPAKYPLGSVVSRREVTTYSTPSDASVSEYSFTLPQPLDLSSLNGRHSWNPGVYLPESPVAHGGYLCSITYADGTRSGQAVLPSLPDLARNTHVQIDITVTGYDTLELGVRTLPWETETVEFDYSSQVGLNQDGFLSFREGTYDWLGKPEASLLLNPYPRVTEGTFGIASPKGAKWDAYLISNPTGAIKFVTGTQNGRPVYSDHISGEVGVRAVFSIGATAEAGAETRSAILQVVVTKPDGTTLPADILQGGGYGSNTVFTIYQNPK